MAKEEKAGLSPEMSEAVDKLLQDVEQRAAKIIDDAEIKAKEIIAGAQAAVKEPVKVDAGPSKEELERAHEKVPVELFKDNNLYKDDVYVAVNGENIKIKRGRRVEIDRMFKEVLDNSRRQDTASAELNERLQDEYESKSKDFE